MEKKSFPLKDVYRSVKVSKVGYFFRTFSRETDNSQIICPTVESNMAPYLSMVPYLGIILILDFRVSAMSGNSVFPSKVREKSGNLD